VDKDSKPDAARAVDMARKLGWDADEWTENVRALARLAIGIFAFGSLIGRNYTASWSPDDPESEHEIEIALDTVGVGYQHIERDEHAKGDEIRPAAHVGQTGRALTVAGAPMGDKTTESIQEFAEQGLNASPRAWEIVDDDRGTVEMVPASTRHTLAVEPVTVHESTKEVLPTEQPGRSES